MMPVLAGILACPACGGSLSPHDHALACAGCSALFRHVNGVPAFINAAPEGMQFTPRKDRSAGSSWRQANNAFYRRFARSTPSDHVVLDVGAGHGYLREYFTAQYVATDVYPYQGIDFLCDLSHTAPLRRASLDAVLLNNVLEHLPEPGRMLAAVAHGLRSGGRVAIAVPFIIKLHQVPYDFLRYTHYMLERLLSAAGFGRITIEAVYTPASLHATFFRELFADGSRPRSGYLQRVARGLAWSGVRAARLLCGDPPYVVQSLAETEPTSPWVTGYHVEATRI